MPGVQSIIGRTKAKGTLSPDQFVDNCLDLIGPLEVADSTRQELVAMAQQQGDLQWDSQHASSSAQRVGDMLALIAASREYQFE
jgi:hypothetical protein